VPFILPVRGEGALMRDRGWQEARGTPPREAQTGAQIGDLEVIEGQMSLR